jgi:protein SCO1/2
MIRLSPLTPPSPPGGGRGESLGSRRLLTPLSRRERVGVRRASLAALGMTLFIAASTLCAQTMAPAPEGIVRADEKPEILKGVGIEQKLDGPLPLEAPLRDEAGNAVRLGDYFGKRPVILALVYFNCPMLCTQVLNGLVSSLSVMSLEAGRDFEVVAVSFDARDTPSDARAKKDAYMTHYRRPNAEAGWHFLTGDAASIARLTTAAGFRYRYDDRLGQFAHASAIMVATPEGRLARYFYGIEYSPRDLRLGLVEASAGRIGTPVDQVLLYCFHYDPARGKYGAAVVNLVRLAGVATLVLLGVSLWTMSRRRAARLLRGASGGAR